MRQWGVGHTGSQDIFADVITLSITVVTGCSPHHVQGAVCGEAVRPRSDTSERSRGRLRAKTTGLIRGSCSHSGAWLRGATGPSCPHRISDCATARVY